MQQNTYMPQAASHQVELLARAERYRTAARAIKAEPENSVAASGYRYELRPLQVDDGEALLRLAQRDDHQLPAGDVLGAFSQGQLLAAISLSDGAYTADPFQSSGEALELLRVRARQLGTRPRRRGLRGLLPGRAGRRAASKGGGSKLAGSPPGAGGRVLQL